MTLVTVSRQTVNDENQLSWEMVDVEVTDLLPYETPYVEPPTVVLPSTPRVENFTTEIP